MDYQLRTIWNVIATIPGTVEPDRWVMIGNHRDAWVYGAVDPGSGTAATLEMCRALGAAVKNGWKPRRTLVYASWDAEEYGLVGSTEWAEQNASMINEKAVLMLNVDSAVSGPELEASGVPSLRELVLDAAGVDHRPPQRQVAPGGLDRSRTERPGRPVRRSFLLTRSGTRRPRRLLISTRTERPATASFPRWARWGRDRTSPRSSITWRSRRSTWASVEGTASITRSTMASTGWRSSAILSS